MKNLLKSICLIVLSIVFSMPIFGATVVLGDVNSDGQINIVDALLVAQYSVGINVTGFSTAAADYNQDGAISIVDALLIAQYSVGIPTVIKHKFLAIDEGNNNILYVNEYDSTKNWVVASTKTTPRDMQLIGNNRVLIGHDAGYSEVDITTGKIVRDLSTYSGITSARRLFNGNTLIAGIGATGTNQIFIIELDPNNTQVRKIVYPGTYIRLIRQTPAGTYMMACDTTLEEGTAQGTVAWKTTVAGFSHCWKAVKLPNGNVVASGGYSPVVVEINPAGTIVRTLGTKAALPKEVNANFFATFQILANGDIVVANWQGHGPGLGSSGVQLLEFDKQGAIVWKWSVATMISSLQGVLVLDGLDTNLLYDERNGAMEQLVN